ncbi:FliM/FliN family flagellar motor switch protein [Parvularcula dongshanensis]|uniref:Flagellar motor switch/type III secretory pathway protein FliN n=1 Tax=Parvularcula dongshanensis TaxID=1173995 RepID=A0A840I5R6_9PROT|nr:FliM/FliN family flagellar motor C-terminal domain-containing protein [Parvularcula dongshanensis]MBB4659613.1 flagellar motor switch/type III secretory pathway protein FliN [Parvularcula dongshanensis]
MTATGLALLVNAPRAWPDRLAAQRSRGEAQGPLAAELLTESLRRKVTFGSVRFARRSADAPPSDEEVLVVWPSAPAAPRLRFALPAATAEKLVDAAFAGPVTDEALRAAVLAELCGEAFGGWSTGQTIEEDGVPLATACFVLTLEDDDEIVVNVQTPSERPTAKGISAGRLLTASLPVEACLGELDLPYAKVSSLKPGDTLPLPPAAAEGIAMRLRGRLRPLARGEMGTDSGVRAVRLTGTAAA